MPRGRERPRGFSFFPPLFPPLFPLFFVRCFFFASFFPSFSPLFSVFFPVSPFRFFSLSVFFFVFFSFASFFVLFLPSSAVVFSAYFFCRWRERRGRICAFIGLFFLCVYRFFLCVCRGVFAAGPEGVGEGVLAYSRLTRGLVAASWRPHDAANKPPRSLVDAREEAVICRQSVGVEDGVILQINFFYIGKKVHIDVNVKILCQGGVIVLLTIALTLIIVLFYRMLCRKKYLGKNLEFEKLVLSLPHKNLQNETERRNEHF